MEPSRAGLEIVDVERHRVDGAVPADDVPRMMVEHVPAHVVRALQPDLRSTVAGGERIGTVEIAFAVRGDLGELSVARAVAIGDIDETGDFHAKDAHVGEIVEVDAVDGAARDDDVVVLLEGETAELAQHRAAAGVHEEDLVRRAVHVQHLLRGHGRDEPDVDVVVDEQPAPPGDHVPLRRQVEALEVRVGVHLLVLRGHEVGRPFADVLRALRQIAVVDER